MSGNTIGGLVGAVVGFWVGGPQGAQIGFSIGSLVGGYVDPVKIQGPRLQDAAKQTAQEGVCIPFGYGQFPVMGNLIWAAPLVEHKHKDSGKGGPVQITYTYTRSYAIGVCEGTIVGLILVKRNGKIVFDSRPTSNMHGQNAKFLAKATVYYGDESQNADPTIESYEGAGNVEPNRGLAYIVFEDDDLTESQGAVPQFEFVVQTCGTSTDANITRIRYIAVGGDSKIATAHFPDDWTVQNSGLGSGYFLRSVAHGNGTFVAIGDQPTLDGVVIASPDGVNWILTTPSPAPSAVYMASIAYGRNGRFVFVCNSGGTADGLIYYGDGYSWSSATPPAGSGPLQAICYGLDRFCAVTSTGWAVVSPDGVNWSKYLIGPNLLAITWTGAHFLAVGDGGATYYSTDGQTWTYGSSPGVGVFTFQGVASDGVRSVACTNSGTGRGIYLTTDLGVTWTRQPSGGSDSYYCACYGESFFLVGSILAHVYVSTDGANWTVNNPWGGTDEIGGLAYVPPDPDWLIVPDADDLFVDKKGNLITQFGVARETSDCAVILGDIVANLCAREGLDPSEYDVSELTDLVKGYRCATEAGADAFIQALMNGYFFDKGEWDGSLWFPKRGRGSVAFLTLDDLAMRNGAAIEQTRIQEAELLRKLNLMTIDPATDFGSSKQTAERRVGTIKAKSEQTEELPLVASADDAAKIVDIRMKIGWAETDKFKFSLPYKWSRLTPTDVIELTDRLAVTHRIRLMGAEEDGGVLPFEGSKDRANTYNSSALGSVNTNRNPNGPGLVGPTIFEVMNLPQLRTEDNAPGMYVAAAGMLPGWSGCTLLMSVDGGANYSPVLTITEASTLGTLIDGITDSSEPITVRVFGGQLSSASTAEVLTGVNAFAILSDDVPEIGNFETVTPTTSETDELTATMRGLKDTLATSHDAGDAFVMLGSVYYLTIDSAFAGQTLYFKAVGFGTSSDAAPAKAVVYLPPEYILDGGAP